MIIPEVILLKTDHEANKAIPITARKEEAKINTPLISIPQMNVTTKNKILFHPAIKTDVVDTLGAGDSFGSCFVGCLLHKFKIEKALKAGIINSSSVIQKIGAKPGLLSLKSLEQKLKKFKGNLIQTFDLD